MKKITLLFILVSCYCTFLSAQDNSPNPKEKGKCTTSEKGWHSPFAEWNEVDSEITTREKCEAKAKQADEDFGGLVKVKFTPSKKKYAKKTKVKHTRKRRKIQ